MKLGGRGGADDRIAHACREIYEDEFGHMMEGIVGLNDEPLSDHDFELKTELVQEQLRARIKMQNEEFSFPLTNERVEGIYNGDINPEPFDFEKAEAMIDHG